MVANTAIGYAIFNSYILVTVIKIELIFILLRQITFNFLYLVKNRLCETFTNFLRQITDKYRINKLLAAFQQNKPNKRYLS